MHEAFKGIGCDKKVVVEVLTTRPFARLQAARAFYERRYDSGFVDRLRYEKWSDYKYFRFDVDPPNPIRKEIGGPLGYLLVKIMEGARDAAEQRSNLTNSPEFVADQLYAGGAARWGTDENAFVDILTTYNRTEMQQICAAYEAKHKSSLEAAVKSEFSGELEMALVALLNGSALISLLSIVAVTCCMLITCRPDRLLLPTTERSREGPGYQRGNHQSNPWWK